ncbi:MAG: TIGR01777 family oxidoreductase [Chitinophagales bacterium]|nr:TIGR01777 family oxidoreductase [Chitinophagales bacterium]
MKTILITGGTGLIGQVLTQKLTALGHRVKILGRAENLQASIPVYAWDIARQQIDGRAFEEVEIIIHLAGANISEGRWTEKRKREIIESRTQSTQLLYDYLSTHTHCVKHILCSSAIGIYGDRGDEWLSTDSAPGNGFLAEVCIKWEKALHLFDQLPVALTINRLGIVLSKNGGAFQPIQQSIQGPFGAILGSGKQYISWIEIHDLANLFLFQIDHAIAGTYHGVAGQLTFTSLIQKIQKAKFRYFGLLMPVPAIILNWILGEKSRIVLDSQRCALSLPKGFDCKVDIDSFIQNTV